ncbi:MAG TPA: hypothetical protein VI112_09680 [Bacteroidia bacterium]|jgi:hypothetical protein
MRFFTILFFFLLFCGPKLFGQTTIVYGTIRDKDSHVLIDNVNVGYAGNNSTSTLKGYSVIVKQDADAVIKFTRVSYSSCVKTINKDELAGRDSLHVDILLTQAPIVLDELPIYGKQKPDTVVGNNSFFIQDFEFMGSDLLLLTTDRFTDGWNVQLATEQQKILAKVNVPVNDVLHFYKDFLGYVNVICKEEIFRVQLNGNILTLRQLPREDFEWMIEPGIDTIHGNIYFSNYRDDYPEFQYFVWNRDDSTRAMLRDIVDKDLALQYSFEYDFLKPKEKLYARKVAQKTGMDKRDVAAYMTDFAHQRWFTPLYAPLFVVRDTVLIFDHYTDRIYKYDRSNKLIDSINISYHHPEKWKEWRRQLLKDETGNSIYGLFLKGGYTYLKEINTYTGNIQSVSGLTFQFVDKVKVRNGYAYYIYRPFGSLQTKFLYKEKLASLK